MEHSELIQRLRIELLSSFGYKDLKKINYANLNYLLLADKIMGGLSRKLKGKKRDKIGNTISDSTLKRLLKYGVDDFHMNTLTKLSIYLGYESWLHFKNHNKVKSKNYYNQAKETKKTILAVVKEGIDALTEAYTLFPKRNIKRLYEIYPKVDSNQSLYEHLSSFKEKKMIGYHCSLEDCKIIKAKNNKALVWTEEYIVYAYRYKGLKRIFLDYNFDRSYIYTLYKKNGCWKIYEKERAGNAFDKFNSGEATFPFETEQEYEKSVYSAALRL